MRKKLLGFIASLLTVLLILPVFNTIQVNAATKKAEEFMAYLKNQGDIIRDLDNNTYSNKICFRKQC